MVFGIALKGIHFQGQKHISEDVQGVFVITPRVRGSKLVTLVGEGCGLAGKGPEDGARHDVNLR